MLPCHSCQKQTEEAKNRHAKTWVFLLCLKVSETAVSLWTGVGRHVRVGVQTKRLIVLFHVKSNQNLVVGSSIEGDSRVPPLGRAVWVMVIIVGNPCMAKLKEWGA